MTADACVGFLDALRRHAWRVSAPVAEAPSIPAGITARHGALPEALVALISTYSTCADHTGQCWLVSTEDLCKDETEHVADAVVGDGEPFRHDEFERMSLDAANGDESWTASIRGFWDRHFPFLLSVHGEYQFFAMALEGDERGAIVYGYGPEFEAVEPVASSLDDFLEQVLHALASTDPPYPFSVALPRIGHP